MDTLLVRMPGDALHLMPKRPRHARMRRRPAGVVDWSLASTRAAGDRAASPGRLTSSAPEVFIMTRAMAATCLALTLGAGLTAQTNKTDDAKPVTQDITVTADNVYTGTIEMTV